MTPVLAPLAGRLLTLASVPDPVFSGELVGPGLAIEPVEGEHRVAVTAPLDGRVSVLHPHAFVIEHDSIGVLVHLGIDTVTLGGGPFEVHTEVGAQVRAGEHLITWDVAGIGALSPLVPVVALSAPGIAEAVAPETSVAAGERIFSLA